MRNEQINHPDRDINYASIFQRLKAYSVDCLFLFIALIIWQSALYSVNPIFAALRSGQTPAPWKIQLWVFLTGTLPFLIYFTWTQSSDRKATIGMRIFNLEVTDLEGRKISFLRALFRCGLLLIPFELNHTIIFHLAPHDAAPPPPEFFIGLVSMWLVIGIYLFAIKFTDKKQSVHDFFAQTIVVNKKL